MRGKKKHKRNAIHLTSVMNCKQKRGFHQGHKHKNQDDERQSRGNTHNCTVNQRLYVWEEEAKTSTLINFMSNALNNGRLHSGLAFPLPSSVTSVLHTWLYGSSHSIPCVSSWGKHHQSVTFYMWSDRRLRSKRYLFSQMSLNMTRGEISAYIITSVFSKYNALQVTNGARHYFFFLSVSRMHNMHFYQLIP